MKTRWSDWLAAVAVVVALGSFAAADQSGNDAFLHAAIASR
ncbi:hypothetical protein C7444_108116 [Sphaerotilus hippei]|uniref:Uncharacterized protein n=1 Tax=Sphaerotilus hippei TaxID=744406 RepID=A0A318H7W5_9BURK|nr:hypothetical protein [Sphaerotilus hippei]PXW95857.1 hypothetical protein C7444_108116 [Sphaerotilus hippei]